ncbi:uncharacterized protein LOC132607468 isoform X2 [Lycium barbarum]|uniref:uncharacterized protein LOC132607468 isoform X2 n=2 Tax=Lycium barbarum TaxID=112863 RepID=UPI00293E5BA8|nr:uncharacterized protein LOC132607468 isoform X2 [Lycium barbarum]XP_060177427.1 uncharacterized protein LOC132607468 isoform X2 [Lycium barbarum]
MSINYVYTDENDRDDNPYLRSVLVTVCDSTHHQSGISFLDIKKARGEIEMLYLLRACPFVANGYYPICEKDSSKKGFALIEPVVSLDTWLKRKENLQFWRYKFENKSKSACIGVGKDFMEIFFQFAKALESIHQAKLFHGNLQNGIMMGLDCKIRICNFKPGKKIESLNEHEKASAQHKDFKEFLNVLKKISTSYGPENQLDLPPDLTLYFKMCIFTKDPQNLRDFRETSKWFYQPPLVWNSARCLFFLDELDQYIDLNLIDFSLKDFLGMYMDWQKVIRGTKDENLIECLEYENGAFIYTTPFGIIRFVKNYKKHYRENYKKDYRGSERRTTRTEAQLVNYVTKLFPNFFMNVYSGVFELRDEFVWNGSRVVTLGTILWGDPSVFDMDKCRS